MVSVLEMSDGRKVSVPDAFVPLEDVDNFPGLHMVRYINSVHGKVAFVFDPDNKAYFEQLDRCREMSKVLSSRVAKLCYDLPVAIDRKFSPSKHVFRISFVIRPVFASSHEGLQPQNDFKVSGKSVVNCFHIDDVGMPQSFRTMCRLDFLDYGVRKLLSEFFEEMRVNYLNMGLVDVEDLAEQIAVILKRAVRFNVVAEVGSLKDAKEASSDIFVAGDGFYYVSKYIESLLRANNSVLDVAFIDRTLDQVMNAVPELDRSRVRNLFFRNFK